MIRYTTHNMHLQGNAHKRTDAWMKLKALFDQEGMFYHAIDTTPSMPTYPHIRTCIIIGIGGSSLGPKSLLAALGTNRIDIRFLENPDPSEWLRVSHNIEPASTLVCVISKSGTTFETLALMQIALAWLGKDRWQKHVLLITDPKDGELRRLSQAKSIPSLPIDPSIGGRFSIFSPVGLFPLALAGHDPAQFLAGARAMKGKTGFLRLAEKLITQFPQRSIHVLMPYASPLAFFGDWFAQLWAESLGKDGKGFTPLAALGAIDQHSILQLLRDGPDDKIVFFMTLGKVLQDVTIPNILPEYPTCASLAGHSLHELLQIEYTSIRDVFAQQGRPFGTVHLSMCDTYHLGALYFVFSVVTAYTGFLWGINPFDQPGVEDGKLLIRARLQQKGIAHVSR